MIAKSLMTAEEFARTGPETDGFELVKGELVPMPPPMKLHGITCAKIVYQLMKYTEQLGSGVVLSNDSGLLTEQDPDTVRGVDVAVFLEPSWQGQSVPKGYGKESPNLAVEVRSPSQSWNSVLAKVAEYLQMGVGLVWVVDPEVRRVTVFTQDNEPYTLAAENEISGGDVLPGFSCKVMKFFD